MWNKSILTCLIPIVQLFGSVAAEGAGGRDGEVCVQPRPGAGGGVGLENQPVE